LATIGSTAPFVGLFGTVMGILNAFKGISEQKATGLAAVAGGIAEALVTTALGLLVAIPAVMMFNYLTGRVEAFDVEMDNSSSELDRLLPEAPRNAPRLSRKQAGLELLPALDLSLAPGILKSAGGDGRRAIHEAGDVGPWQYRNAMKERRSIPTSTSLPWWT